MEIEIDLMEKLHLNQSKLPLIKGKTSDSSEKTTLDIEECHVYPLHCSPEQVWNPKRQEYFPFLLPPFAEIKLQLSVVSIDMHDANFL